MKLLLIAMIDMSYNFFLSVVVQKYFVPKEEISYKTNGLFATPLKWLEKISIRNTLTKQMQIKFKCS